MNPQHEPTMLFLAAGEERPICRIRKLMARSIEITDSAGKTHEFRLSIATVSYAADGSIASIAISPFRNEIAGVEYLDSPFIISLKE